MGWPVWGLSGSVLNTHTRIQEPLAEGAQNLLSSTMGSPNSVKNQRKKPVIQPSILVVHPDATIRQQCIDVLNEVGLDSTGAISYTVAEASTVRMALHAIKTAPPDLLILDPLFGDRDTKPLLSHLQEQPIRATMAILALDGNAQLQKVLEEGADDVLTLPFTPQALRLKVQSLLRLKLAERTTRALVARQVRDQQLLQRAGQQLGMCRSLEETLTSIAALVREGLGYDRVGIALYDAVSSNLRNWLSTDEQGHVVLVGPYTSASSLSFVNLAPGSPLSDLPAYQALFEYGQPIYYIPDTGGLAPAYFRPYMPGPIGETFLVALPAVHQPPGKTQGASDRTMHPPIGLITVDNMVSGRPFGPEEATLLIALAAQAARAIDRTRTTEALLTRAQQAEAMAQVGMALTATLEPDHLYQLILEQAATVLPYDYALVLIPDGEWARIAAIRGSVEAQGPGQASAPSLPLHAPVIELSSAAGAALTGAVRIVTITTDPIWRDLPLWAGEGRMQSVLIVPLLIDGALLGSLLLASFSAGSYTEQHEHTASSFAEVAVRVLRNAQLYAEERKQVRGAQSPVPLQHQSDGPVLHPEEDSLLDDLRLISQVENGSLTPVQEPTSVRALVQRAAKRVRIAHPGKRMSLDGSPDLLTMADPAYTERVVAALLDNAARYAPKGTPISVSWAVEEDMAVLRVRDQGPGVPSPETEWFFSRLAYGPNRQAAATQDHKVAQPSEAPRGPVPEAGLGLGLFLSRCLARAMHGDLRLESTSAAGSVFRLQLPLVPD